jgi:hypothetical protein
LNPWPALTAHFSAIKALVAEKDTVNLKIASFELNSTSVRVIALLKKTKTMKTNEMTPVWVVENFLPDFKELWYNFVQLCYEFCSDGDFNNIIGIVPIWHEKSLKKHSK